MPFDALHPPPRAVSAKALVRVGVRAVSETAPTRLSLMIADEVLQKINKAQGQMFSVELGKGEDRHLLRITADGPFQAFKFKSGKGTRTPLCRIILPPNDRWPICKIKMQEVSFEIKGGALLITLPSWGWDNDAKARIEKRNGG